MISDRLKAAIKDNSTEESKTQQTTPINEEPENKIITTQEELEAFYIIKSILKDTLPFERIGYRDAQTYFSILVDDNNRKPICRLYLNSPTNKRITFIGEDKKEQHNKITSIDDIYNIPSKLLMRLLNICNHCTKRVIGKSNSIG